MPRKIMKEVVDEEEVDEPQQQPITKPKREITEAQREHLNKIRELALEKKRQMKETTLKAKLAKTVVKEDLAKKYDDYVAKKVVEQQPTPESKPKVAKKSVKPESESEESEVEEVIVKRMKKPKKIKKKIIYESESESEEEVVVRKKSQKKPLEKLVYNNTKEQLYNRMIEERVKNSMLGYSQALGI
jgi:hypothetical protein